MGAQAGFARALFFFLLLLGRAACATRSAPAPHAAPAPRPAGPKGGTGGATEEALPAGNVSSTTGTNSSLPALSGGGGNASAPPAPPEQGGSSDSGGLSTGVWVTIVVVAALALLVGVMVSLRLSRRSARDGISAVQRVSSASTASGGGGSRQGSAGGSSASNPSSTRSLGSKDRMPSLPGGKLPKPSELRSTRSLGSKDRMPSLPGGKLPKPSELAGAGQQPHAGAWQGGQDRALRRAQERRERRSRPAAIGMGVKNSSNAPPMLPLREAAEENARAVEMGAILGGRRAERQAAAARNAAVGTGAAPNMFLSPRAGGGAPHASSRLERDSPRPLRNVKSPRQTRAEASD